MREPEFVARKSAWKAVTLLRVLFCWLIIPLIIMIANIIKIKSQRIEFYDNVIVQKSGIIAKHERKTAFAGVISVSVNQSVCGRIFGYGDVTVDVVGKWDIDTRGIKNPEKLKRYLERRIINSSTYQRSAIHFA